MATLGDMKIRITAELRRGDLGDRVDDAIASAIRFYERQRFRFNEGWATAVTAAGEARYAPPADLVLIDTLRITAGGASHPLTERSWGWMEAAALRAGASGRPTDHTLYAGQLHLHPVPDAAYRLEMAYVTRLPPLGGDADANAWTTDAEELARCAAKKRLYAHVLREPDMAAAMQALENEALTALRGEATAQIGIGRITPTHF